MVYVLVSHTQWLIECEFKFINYINNLEKVGQFVDEINKLYASYQRVSWHIKYGNINIMEILLRLSQTIWRYWRPAITFWPLSSFKYI